MIWKIVFSKSEKLSVFFLFSIVLTGKRGDASSGSRRQVRPQLNIQTEKSTQTQGLWRSMILFYLFFLVAVWLDQRSSYLSLFGMKCNVSL